MYTYAPCFSHDEGQSVALRLGLEYGVGGAGALAIQECVVRDLRMRTLVNFLARNLLINLTIHAN